MAHWYLVLLVSFVVMLVGLSIHWTVVLAGALLPLVPLVTLLLRRRRRNAAQKNAGEGN
ncbi:MAG: hypothetical protein JSV45_02775 [Chromatiales bacterium]|nr:MAG: hypothetical protein JSV45_02775 [Chromatiales bacterium]